MTQEEKQILLIDLSARQPYGVKVTFQHNGFRWDWPQTLDEIKKCDDGDYAINGWGIHGIKPYLRPMSSMTDKEKDELYTAMDWYGETDEAGNVYTKDQEKVYRETFYEYTD